MLAGRSREAEHNQQGMSVDGKGAAGGGVGTGMDHHSHTGQ